MNKKILHIIQDEKFPDSAFEVFETVAPGISHYVLAEKKRPLKYLKKIQPERISRLSFLNPFFRKSLEQYDVVILHALTEFNCELIARCSKKVKFHWIGLGFDYYDLIYPNKLDLLEPITRDLVYSKIYNFIEKSSRNIIRKIFRKIIYRNIKKKSELIKKIRWFSPVIESEYWLLRDILNVDVFPEYINWNYALTANLFEIDMPGLDDSASNILVGNSASPYNNHLEIFEYLKNLEIPKNSKIIVPLSYGDDDYREFIVNEGFKVWGGRFKPITEFISFEKYIKIISSCPIVIMNHKRQQAGGNISSALHVGAKVFLNKNNLFYDEYKKRGATIFDIDDLTVTSGIFERILDESSIKNNRDIVKSMRSRKVIEDKTRYLIQQVLNK